MNAYSPQPRDASRPDRPALRAAHLPENISPAAQHLILNVVEMNDCGHYLPYYQLLEFAPDFEATLAHIPRKSLNYPGLENLIAWSIAEALDSIPILSVRFWRIISQHELVCASASQLIDDQYSAIHHRLGEELTLFGLAQDLETKFENIFPNLWTGPRHTPSGQVHDQIDPAVQTSLLMKIDEELITTETTGLKLFQIARIVDALTDRGRHTQSKPSGAAP